MEHVASCKANLPLWTAPAPRILTDYVATIFHLVAQENHALMKKTGAARIKYDTYDHYTHLHYYKKGLHYLSTYARIMKILGHFMNPLPYLLHSRWIRFFVYRITI